MAIKKTKSDTQYEMTVDELLSYARAFIGKTLYAKGGQCEKLTKRNLDILANRYSNWYHRTKCKVAGYRDLTNYEYLSKFIDKGYFIADCCGLWKGIRAGARADGTKGHMTPEIDQTIEEMANSLVDKVKDVYDAGDGYMVYFSDYSHVMGISEAGKKDIESAPSLNGVKEVNIGYQPISRIGGAGKFPWVDYSPKDKIDEDGIWGMKTTRKAQQVFKTFEDGIVSRQLSRFKVRCAACTSGWKWSGVSSDKGSDLIRAMQKWLGVTVDGHFGTKTIEALQKKMGTTVDGRLDYPSPCVKAFQRWLNER